MRAIGLLATAALLLGCEARTVAPADPAENAATLPAPPAPSETPRPATPPPAPAKPARPAPPAAEIPAAFHGAYDSSIEECGRPSISKLRVSARELRFHESLGEVRSVATEPSGAIRVEADYDGEGQSWRSVRTLSLSDGGATLTMTGDGTKMVRVRCPLGAS